MRIQGWKGVGILNLQGPEGGGVGVQNEALPDTQETQRIGDAKGDFSVLRGEGVRHNIRMRLETFASSA